MDKTQLEKIKEDLEIKEEYLRLKQIQNVLTEREKQIEQQSVPPVDISKYRNWAIGIVVGITLFVIAIRIIGRFI